MRSALGLTLVATLALAACSGTTSPGSEGAACKDDLDCASTLFCHLGACRHQNCQEFDCPAGWACIDQLCCNQSRCCGREDQAVAGTCDNGLDDDCDGWTDEADDACAPGCREDPDCDDEDPCTEDRCVQGECTHAPIPGACCRGTGAFSPAGRFDAADDPAFLNAADLDLDGAVDLIMGTDNDHAVVVLPGLGDGTFGAKQAFAVGIGPWATGIGDFDGDGLPDVAAVDYAGAVWLLRNRSPTQGQIDFAPASSISIGGNPLGIAVADLDQNGALDLVVALRDANQLAILLGDGLGGFQSAGQVATGQEPWWVAVDDFDSNGLLDLASANSAAGTLSVLLADGPASFGAASQLTVQAESQYLLATDLDGDGHPDLVASNRGSARISVLLGLGDGTFEPAVSYPTEPGGQPRSFAAGDFDADGRPDLVVSNPATDSLSVLLGAGDGSFTPGVQYPVSGRPDGVVARDLDGDGVLDLAISCGSADQVQVLLGAKVCQ